MSGIIGMKWGIETPEEEIRVSYICDPAKNCICEKTECFLNGGECMHTINPRFAKNFIERIGMAGVAYYEEEDDSQK